MSPATQFQTSPSLFPSSFPLPHPSSFPYNYSPATKFSTSHFSPEPWSSHSQISSPASLDSTGDTGSSPTSPLSPGSRGEQQWYQPTPFLHSNFPPPNTVAPPPELHKYQHGGPQQAHRPDAVFGGGSHRLVGPLRGGLEMVQDSRDSYTARHYGGSANTVAPSTSSTSSSSSSSYHNNLVHSPGPGPYPRAESCSSYGSMMSPSETQLTSQVTKIIQQLGMSQEDLILKSTRDLNKLLKVSSSKYYFCPLFRGTKQTVNSSNKK